MSLSPISWLLGLVALVGSASPGHAAEGPPDQPPAALSPEDAILWALEHNPEIAAVRQQHGVAAAGVVIANTYPFNPVLESKVRYATGPESAGVTNVLSNEHKLLLDVEVRGQPRIRREAAHAALSRTDLEIAWQEVALAVRAVRAFDAVVYRHRKRQILKDAVELNTRAAAQVDELVQKARLNAVEGIVIHAELEDAVAQVAPGTGALVAAQRDLARALNVTAATYTLVGGFEAPPALEAEAERLLQAALEHRPDLLARQAAVAEADARLRLEVANRFGNPNVGPAYEYDPTRVNLIGVQVSLPLPVFNTHRGEIQQREAERARAAAELRQAEAAVRQDVAAAVARLRTARQTLAGYQGRLRPQLERALKDLRTLFDARAPGVDLLRVIDVQRKYIKARESELDALYELRLAVADLALAVGDPFLAVRPAGKP
jgi:cobalt-zinc-cadmium efflux system outer membrane protein